MKRISVLNKSETHDARTIQSGSELGNTAIVLVILVSAAGAVLQTDPTLLAEHMPIFIFVELVSTIIFTIEYFVRFLWSGGFKSFRSALRYVFSVSAIIDFISLIPFYINLFLGTNFSILVLLRLFRLLKLVRYFESLRLLGTVLRSEARSLLSLMMVLFILIVAVSTGMYLLEGRVQPEAFGTIPRSMWWAVVTLTTLGYGDVVPMTPAGQMFASLITVLAIGTVALPAGILASRFSEELEHRRKRFKEIAKKMRPEDGYCEITSAKLIETACDTFVEGEDAQRLIAEIEAGTVVHCKHCGAEVKDHAREKID